MDQVLKYYLLPKSIILLDIIFLFSDFEFHINSQDEYFDKIFS